MITHPRIIVSVVLVLVTTVATSQLSEGRNEENSCDSKVTCSECIQTNNCTWCMEADRRTRCLNASLTSPYCSEKYVWNPGNEENILSMQELTPAGFRSTSDNQQNIVHMSPQRISLKLRISECECVIYNDFR